MHMQKDSKLFDDFAKLASGAAGTVLDKKREIEAMVMDKVEKSWEECTWCGAKRVRGGASHGGAGSRQTGAT